LFEGAYIYTNPFRSVHVITDTRSYLQGTKAAGGLRRLALVITAFGKPSTPRGRDGQSALETSSRINNANIHIPY
jgi:hypothetical protein